VNKGKKKGRSQRRTLAHEEDGPYACCSDIRIVYTSSTPTQANIHDIQWEKMCLFAGISGHRRITTTLWICLHTAEVAGSNPASSTQEKVATAKRRLPEENPSGLAVIS
jgi:hypothetical protein